MSQMAGSPKAQKNLREYEKQKEDQRVRDLGWVLSTPSGRRFMFHLIDSRCLLFSQSYTGNSETYLREGRRVVGIELTGEIQKRYPNEYVMMISEAFNLKQRDALIEETSKKIAEGDDE